MNHSSSGCHWVEPTDEPVDERKKHAPQQLAEVVSDGGEQSIDAIALFTGEGVAIQSVVRLHMAYMFGSIDERRRNNRWNDRLALRGM